MSMRIGQGFDVHGFTEGDHVVLGGVRIAHDRGVDAHSDGDVALHALCDALLGAAGLGDIGKHFPPDDITWKGANSRDLIRTVRTMLAKEGWSVVNADMTIICEKPRVLAHVPAMRENIAADLQTRASHISVKATTTEKLGFLGRGEGIAATAVVLLSSN